MAATNTTNLGLSSPGEEREKLDRLLKLFDNSIVFGARDGKKRRVGFAGTVNDEDEEDRPKLTQRVKTFYVDSWPEIRLNPDGSYRPKSSRIIGGTPITTDTAVALRQIVYGSPYHSFSREWKKSVFEFQDMSSPHPWGLQTHRWGSRGLVLCVQGFLLKHLIFDREYFSMDLAKSALVPNEFERKRALIGALCEILWAAGEKKRCCICLSLEERCYDQDHRVRDDGITEKLYLYEFKKFQDLQLFVKRHLENFQTGNSFGCICFLYSVVLSRTVYKIREDMQLTEDSKDKLLTDNEECSQALINLLLTGHAVRHLHNGNMVYNQYGKLLDISHPLRGIKQRSHVGYMFWDKTEDSDKRTEVGSMLKTPKCPIWLTNINSQIGLLFSINLDLVSDWRIENRFVLYYYTGLSSHPKCCLNIETRLGREVKGRTSLIRKGEEEKIPQLEQCIMTKWYGAAVDWNGTPYFY